MILRMKKKDGTQVEFELGERPITIGRSPEADLMILDEKASRIHCGIRLWDGDFYIKDLRSKNGTFVNGQQIDMVKLNPGDRIRVGSMSFAFEVDAAKGTQTVLQEVVDEMAQGKGYSTLLHEIIQDADESREPAPAAAPEAGGPTMAAAPTQASAPPERRRTKLLKVKVPRRAPSGADEPAS
jgi:pSer/pThr/pTyr-binding forkhead associated (FHA) protein